MQEHTEKYLRISALIWLLLLALTFPYLFHYYEQQHVFQWEDMVQPHWEKVIVPTPAHTEDVVGWKNLDVPAVLPDMEIAEPKKSVPVDKPVLNKPVPKAVARKKNDKLTLKVPENIYQGEVAAWEDKKQVPMPDFFAPKKDGPDRFQFGGRLIIDEDNKKKKESEAADASYLDAVQGAEVNISISTP
ncbi:MAG TPA: hypothetical protein VLB90_05760 [Pseudomonadales bacterium]|nr:hypothetical protein [Pseudomonadales bacterium]